MNILFIGNYYPLFFEKIIIEKQKSIGLSFSSNHFNSRFIDGLLSNEYAVHILSCPIFGSFPNNTRIKRFTCKDLKSDGFVNYCYYNNNRLIRMASRTHSIIRQIKKVVKQRTYDVVVISEMHLPFLKTIKVLKKKTQSIITIIVPDLPEYSYLGSKKRPFYSLVKKFYNKEVYKAVRKADSFVFLSKHMNNSLINPLNKPFVISETFVEQKAYYMTNNKIPVVTYCGTLHRSFGIKTLLDAFKHSGGLFKLVIAGSGDMEEEIINISKSNHLLEYKGQITASELEELYKKTDVFVNPRSGLEKFAKVSFPSKIGEYLSYLKPTVAFDLPSFDDGLRNILIIPNNETPDELLKSICYCLKMSKTEKNELRDKISNYISRYYPRNVILKIEKELWKSQKN